MKKILGILALAGFLSGCGEGECLYLSDCTNGQICTVHAKCVDVRTCFVDTDCALGGMWCVAGMCMDNTSCNHNDDCEGQQVCGNTSELFGDHWSDGSCFPVR